MFLCNNKGQALLEGLIITLILIFVMFASIQVCVMVVDDMYLNYASFSATRKAIVSQNSKILTNAKKVISVLFLPYQLKSKSVLYYKPTHWSENILGHAGTDHSGQLIKKHNIKIQYYTDIMFHKLFNLFTSIRTQYARARMVKSPDQDYYNKAYPNAKNFPSISVSIQ